jgi:hypothetical protein
MVWRTLALLPVLAAGLIAAAAGPPRTPVLAHFRFDGNARDEVAGNPDFELKNARFQGNALALNGKYDGTDRAAGFRAVCRTPKLDYRAFAVALRFKFDGFGPVQNNLFTGGTSYRWFGMHRPADGHLVVTLNNHNHADDVFRATIDVGRWHVVACGVDVPGRKVVVWFDGKKAGDFTLPKDFKLDVIGSDGDERDRVWTFTNYGNGTAFPGLVDELIVYGGVPTAAEFAAVPLRP